MPFDTISVIGLGYIGLPTAAIIAAQGKNVIGVDIDRETVATINHGDIHIIEPGLDVMVRNAVQGGYLRATTCPEPADAFLIAVPTPFKVGEGNDHVPDLSCIEAASSAIAPVLKKGDLIILESTSPLGTTERVAAWLAEARPDLSFPQTNGEASDIRVAHCPERVLPGHVIHELVKNDRIIGGMTAECTRIATQLYRIFVEGRCIPTAARIAEMVKLTENSFRDVNIAFANELSIVCDKLDIDVWELIRLANDHPRVGILQPGPGVGGHCIAVDPWFIVSEAPQETRLIRTAREVNDSKPRWVVDRINETVDRYLLANPDKTAKDVTIACFGLAFKANIDDLRESPASRIVGDLLACHPGPILVVEPNIEHLPRGKLESAMLVSEARALHDADIVVMLVDHEPFKRVPISRVNRDYLVDSRGLWVCRQGH